MKDKEIRKILIEYLKTQETEMRIYNEKSISAVICDVLAVTDKLTGYEIKSDSDNYRRLKRQISCYDYYFDTNYLVVGKTHRSSAMDKVPGYWGIICVEEAGLTVLREAKANSSASAAGQLSLLWRNELKNILKKNNMPMYNKKAKYFIIGKITESIDEAVIKEQTAYELLHRDYSCFVDADDLSIYISGSLITELENTVKTAKNHKDNEQI